MLDRQDNNYLLMKMYVTKPLSWYKKFPAELAVAPSGADQAPSSGVLVTLDEEAEPTCRFGLCKDDHLDKLPFPQDKIITVRYSTGAEEHRKTYCDPAFFIPVLGHPLSSNRYYVLKPRGSNKGKGFTSSKEEDAVTCCFCKCFSDSEPQPVDHHDVYQEFEICRRRSGYFVAKSVAPDGVPPTFLRRKYWQASISTPRNFTLGEASGVNISLRSRLPEFNFPLSCKTSGPVVVGKWYCPYIFIKDGRSLKDQIAKSMYYEMTLDQRWEQVFTCDRAYNEGNVVAVDVNVEREAFRVGGNENEALNHEKTVVNGVMSFRNGEADIGLNLAIVERMKWEQERFGWTSKDEKEERIKRVEEFGSGGVWNKFGCYILVERFVLRRVDGSLALTYDFKHTHQVRSKWE